MSIAAKCECNKNMGGFCIGGEGCKWHNYEPNKYWIDRIHQLEKECEYWKQLHDLLKEMNKYCEAPINGWNYEAAKELYEQLKNQQK